MSDILPLVDHPAILRTFANPAAIADNAVVAAVAGRKIKVLAMKLWNNAATANTATVKSNAAAISAPYTMQAAMHGSIDFPYNEAGWFLTNLGEALNLALTAATAVGATVVYTLV